MPRLRPLLLIISINVFVGSAIAQPVQYQPIIYKEGDILSSPHHAWLVVNHPVTTGVQFLNARIMNNDTSVEVWIVQNLPIESFASPRPIHYRMNLSPIQNFSGGMPAGITVDWAVGAYQEDENFIQQDEVFLEANPVKHFVPSGRPRMVHSVIPQFPLQNDSIFPPVWPPEGFTRMCSVPNVDLNTMIFSDPFDGDSGACAPAAAANSMQWLQSVHPEIDSLLEIDSLRELLEEMKFQMGFDTRGVLWDDFVKGKLSIIDAYRLPIRVKYQVHTPYPGFAPIIMSPDEDYCHAAENQTGPTGIPDFDWLCNELKNGEDIELGITYWCDSMGVRVEREAHSVNLTGYFSFGNDRWLVWKHDTRQDTVGGTVEEFGRWAIDSIGYPYLSEMTATDSTCIAYVGDAVSESYDSTMTFPENIRNLNLKYRPVGYLEGSQLEGYPHHAWLTFDLPLVDTVSFLNVVACNPISGARTWAVRNLPLPTSSPFEPVRYRMDLADIAQGDTLPNPLIIKYEIDGYRANDSFPLNSYKILEACPEVYLTNNGVPLEFHPLIPRFPPILLPVTLPPNVDYVWRGCEVPNIDLDSSTHASDWNACGPAATANSMQWLDDAYDEIDIPIEIRAIMDSLKRMMKHPENNGTYWDDMVRGKLEFIDKYNLPIRVKYQAHGSAPAEIASPDPRFGHKAVNQGPPDPDKPGKFLHPTFDWLCAELEANEDVEMTFGWHCDTTLMPGDTFPDGSIVTMDTTLMKRKQSHAINVTGKIEVGPLKWIAYKQDVHQGDQGGTTRDNTPDTITYTDFSRWVEVNGGYVFLEQESGPEKDGDYCRAFVETVLTESYDPTVDFCIRPEVPDDAGARSLREAIANAMPGDTICLDALLANDTICLTSAPLTIDKDIVIRGDHSLNTVIQGKGVPVFEVTAGSEVTLDGLRVLCGDTNEEPCVLNSGKLTLRDIEFAGASGNSTEAAGIVNSGFGVLRIEGTTNVRE